jgi:hypothetical protein
MTKITINGSLINDQSEGLTNNDFALDYVAGTNTFANEDADPTKQYTAGFLTALNGLFGASSPLSVTTSLDDRGAFADLVEGAKSAANFVTVDPEGSNVTNLFFSDPGGSAFDGDQVFLDGVGGSDPMKAIVGGSLQSVYLWSITDDFVIATTSGTKDGNGKIQGDVVAAFFLKEAGNHLSASVEMVTFLPLFHPDPNDPDDDVNWSDLLNISAATSLSFNFDVLDSGNFLWAAVGTEEHGVLITGRTLDVDASHKVETGSDMVNTSQGGQGATIGIDNQMFEVGNTAVLTLVDGFQPLPTAAEDAASTKVKPQAHSVYSEDHFNSQGTKVVDEGINYTAYNNVTTAKLFFSQDQGSGTFAATITALSTGPALEEGDAYITGLENDTTVPIYTVTVYAASPSLGVLGTKIATWVLANPDASKGEVLDNTTVNGVKVDLDGANIHVSGLDAFYTVEWSVANPNTQATETFNRFLLQADGGKFDIGRLDIDNATTVVQPVGGNLIVEDDGPEGNVKQGVDPLVVDDTNINKVGGSTDFVNVTDLFTAADFNTDGGGTASLSLSISAANVLSGLTDTLTGEPIRFLDDSADVIGYVDDD